VHSGKGVNGTTEEAEKGEEADPSGLKPLRMTNIEGLAA
jgi:hypothetical protein